jgi:hypothetical protein
LAQLLPKNKVIWPEELTVLARLHGVHSPGLQIHEDRSGDVFAASCFVVINIDPFELKIRVTMRGISRANAMLVGGDFPELRTNLVPALAGLDVHSFTHGWRCEVTAVVELINGHPGQTSGGLPFTISLENDRLIGRAFSLSYRRTFKSIQI